MALVRAYGLSHQRNHSEKPSRAMGNGRQASGARPTRLAGQPVVVSDPVSALEPILQSRAAHFWHELRCVWRGDAVSRSPGGSTGRDVDVKQMAFCWFFVSCFWLSVDCSLKLVSGKDMGETITSVKICC